MLVKFIATQELVKLAKRLRMYGYDTVVYKEKKRGAFIIQALKESRVMLTRKRNVPGDFRDKTIVVDAESVGLQLKQVFTVLKLAPSSEVMCKRCTLCNDVLSEIRKDDYKEAIPALAFKNYEHFSRCLQCNKIYWRGTHVEKIKLQSPGS